MKSKPTMVINGKTVEITPGRLPAHIETEITYVIRARQIKNLTEWQKRIISISEANEPKEFKIKLAKHLKPVIRLKNKAIENRKMYRNYNADCYCELIISYKKNIWVIRQILSNKIVIADGKMFEVIT